jgi:hypothetical protein
MPGDLDDLTDDIRKERQQLMACIELALSQGRVALRSEEQRLLEHFWQRQHNTTREFLTLNELVFLESDSRGVPGMHSMIRADLIRPLGMLVNKGYLSVRSYGKEVVYRLDLLGVRYMAQAHPDTVANAQKLLGWLVKQPLYVLIGLVASLVTIAGALSALAVWML